MHPTFSAQRTLSEDFSHAWKRYWTLRKQRDEATWARFLITSGFAIGFPSLFMALASAFGRVRWSAEGLMASYALGFVVAFLIHGLYRASERLLSEAQLQRLSKGWPAAVFHILLPIAGVAGGMALFAPAYGWLRDVTVHTPFESARGIQQFLLISLIFSLIGTYLAWQSQQKQALRLQATEARLLRLQAQIEPHFLFNSLAAVQSLMGPAPERAQAMLEHFTDYLRSSLDTLRQDSCTLEQELQAARSYLSLMQIRMNDRLRFELQASAEARAAVLPPLLLQPLVENAIVHGLEGKVEGGTLRLSAVVEHHTLRIRVEDDGLGHNARKRATAGQGLALQNIRQRLQARYDDAAQLRVTPGAQGCVAELSLPYSTANAGQ